MKYLIITEADWQSLRDEVLSLATCCLKAFGEESNYTDWLHNGDVCRLLGISKRTLFPELEAQAKEIMEQYNPDSKKP